MLLMVQQMQTSPGRGRLAGTHGVGDRAHDPAVFFVAYQGVLASPRFGCSLFNTGRERRLSPGCVLGSDELRHRTERQRPVLGVEEQRHQLLASCTACARAIDFYFTAAAAVADLRNMLLFEIHLCADTRIICVQT